MSRRAFTLIEVMVVLSILAIIAILAYNFFGNSMKDATLKQRVTQLKRDMQVISDAVALYEKDGNAASTVDGDLTPLVTGGYIKAIPSPPPVMTSGFETNIYRFDYQYDCLGPASVQFDLKPACIDDDLVQLRNVSDDVCRAVNEAYGPWYSSYPIWDYDKVGGEPSEYPNEGEFWCVEWSGSNKVMLVHALRE